MTQHAKETALVTIACSYFSNNTVEIDDIGRVLNTIASALNRIDSGDTEQAPAVPIDESVTDDHIICLEDGEPVTLLKRYLSTRYDMSPEEYREKWGLPEDYPFVAKNYSEKRRAIAKSHGLGKVKTD